MKKIRINELARELEVKPNKIIELLPEVGVDEKKTHSSSIDEDAADKIKRRLLNEEKTYPELEQPGFDDAEERGLFDPIPAPAVHAREPASKAVLIAAEPHPVAHKAQPMEEAASPTAPTTVEEKPAPVRVQPLRPPLSHGSPLHPPVSQPGAPRPQAPPVPQAPVPPAPASQVPHVPAAPQPAAPARPAPPAPAMPPAGMIVSGPKPGSIQVKPLPVATRPGQILTGPRQPFPSIPAAPAMNAVPGAPRPPQMPRPPQTQRPSQIPRPPVTRPAQSPHVAAPGSQLPGHQPQRPAAPAIGSQRPLLAGQPVVRPVIPPRPDLVARLQQQNQQQAKLMPGQPQVRPPSPGRPQSTPIPGQPIYRGPMRPGQQAYGRPPGPGGPPRPGMRGRPMHPTSGGGVRLEPEVVLTDAQRRDASSKRGRPGAHVREEQEGRLRMPSRRHQQEGPPPVDREITIAEGITVGELSEKLGVKANLVIKKLVERKIFATINQSLDAKLAEEVSREFGASTNKISYEEESLQEVTSAEDTKDVVKRPPVVTIMGHVDHGKTSLLDAIRSTNVAGREAGGITQHIGAYQVEKNGQPIVFIDTPGHAAFTHMRARGAKVTDIVVLVVAADDGVMPQTLEAIDHARAAEVPIIVAVNKCDKPDAQPERIKQQLSDRGLLPEDWGGTTVFVNVSAKAQTNLDLLLEMILLVAEMEALTASPSRPAMGTVLEQKLDRGRGPVATVLVQNGTLNVGDYFICGSVFGKVRAMFDDRGAPVRSAGPSMPVEVLGLESLPDVGDTFQVVTDTAKAKQIVIYRESKAREQAMAKGARLSLDQLHEQLKEGEVKELPVILKTDVGGTAEVITETLQKLSNEKVKVRVLHGGVGAINDTDVLLASASNAVIIGFNVRPERNAVATAEKEKVDIRLHTIIYELTDEMKRAMTGMLDPVYKEAYKGRAEIREVYTISKVGSVAGCMVIDGVIQRDCQIRLLRDNVVVHTGKLDSLKRFKNDASEVKTGFECGATIANFNDIKPGDIIEAFGMDRVKAELPA